jgi:hypothetical protein
MNRVKSLIKPVKKVYRSIYSTILTWDLKKLAKKMTVLAVVVGLAGGYIWFSRMYMSDERRFWIAINNSMSTSSVTRTLTNGGTGNEVTQDQQFFFAPQMVSRSHVSFSQKSATIDTEVETEGIAFPDAQYSRYTVFRTNQAREDGSIPNLDSILGKWEGSPVEDTDKERSKLNYVGELVTLAVFGNFDATFRRELIKELKANGTYNIDFSRVEPDATDKNIFTVSVNIKLKPYATSLQKSFVKAGYGEFPALNPENYRDDAAINAQFQINKRSNSITGINFGSRQESYSSYGISSQIIAPKTDYKGGELEKIVQDEIGSAL